MNVGDIYKVKTIRGYEIVKITAVYDEALNDDEYYIEAKTIKYLYDVNPEDYDYASFWSFYTSCPAIGDNWKLLNPSEYPQYFL